ncbi:hypothetical protein EVAR_66652_1 [Eumeta japonica]|uniref:Uncharacterized protein n=1 Tax=Eumeta variegata TaxID=151549 RepID=A0A4C1ZQJ4_EUMVA|nr:hypothetical protein EVAR_66652_1 [Eumeta japonica]
MDELSVKCLLCADNQVLLAPSTCGLQETVINKMNDSVKKRGTCRTNTITRTSQKAAAGVRGGRAPPNLGHPRRTPCNFPADRPPILPTVRRRARHNFSI